MTMDLAQLPVTKEWWQSWLMLARNKGVALASGLVDVVFFLAFGFLTAPVYDKLTEHVIIIGTLVSEQLRAAAGRARPAVFDVLFQEPVSTYTWQFAGLLVLLAAIVFVLVVVLQGLNWWLAASLANEKQSWRTYLTGFAKVNALWFILFVLWYALDAVVDLRRLVIERTTGQPAAGASIALWVVLAAIAYFALASYPSVSIRKAFAAGTRKAVVLVPAMLAVAAHFLAGNLVLQGIALLSRTAMLVIGVVLLLGLLSWARLYICLVLRRVHGV